MKKIRLFFLKSQRVLVALIFICVPLFQSCGPSAKQRAQEEQHKKGVIQEDEFGKITYDFSKVITIGNRSIIPTGILPPTGGGRSDIDYLSYSEDNLTRFSKIVNEFEKYKHLNVLNFEPYVAMDDQTYLLTTNQPILPVDTTNKILIKENKELIEKIDIQNKVIKRIERKVNIINKNIDSLKETHDIF